MARTELIVDSPYFHPSNALRAMAEMVSAPVFDPACIERLFVARRNSVTAASTEAATIAHQIAVRSAIARHPKGSPLLSLADIDVLTRTDLVNAYAAAVRPDKLTLFVAGHIARAELTKAIAALEEPWPHPVDLNPNAKKTAPIKPLSDVIAKTIVVDLPGRTKIAVSVDIDLPGSSNDGSTALAVHTLVDKTNGRLKRQWRDAMGISLGVRAWVVDDEPHAHVAFELEAPNDRLEAVLAVLDKQLEALAATGPSDDEIESTKRADLVLAAAAVENPDELSLALENVVRRGRPMALFTSPSRRFASITNADVRRAAIALHPRAARIVLVGDRAIAERALKSVFQRTAQLRDATGNVIPQAQR